MFNNLLPALGCKHKLTTSYHPQCNGLIERFHRTLKSALRSSQPHEWSKKLPLVLLGLRVSVKEELGCSSAEMMFGHSLKLPVDLLGEPTAEILTPCSYADSLRIAMQRLSYPVTRPVSRKSYIDPKLPLSTHVFVRNDAKHGLQPYYRGPYKVIERHDKYYSIQLDGRVDKVSVDRLKTAHLEYDPNLEPSGNTVITVENRGTVHTNQNLVANAPTVPDPANPADAVILRDDPTAEVAQTVAISADNVPALSTQSGVNLPQPTAPSERVSGPSTAPMPQTSSSGNTGARPKKVTITDNRVVTRYG